ncbi:MAG: IMPACT family protein [Oscillospiraceae bacterium]|nr:IMPACT family protein [Oscillospiraceae bacterium]
MRASYRTLRGEGVAEYEEKRSRFIGAAGPAASEREALDFLAAVRARHKDVSHHVFAYVCGESGNTKRCSDAGEPKGTAGVPVLEVIEKSGLSDVVIAVTRYYGGTNLGAAGLIRSYGKAASLAVGAAGIVIKSLARQMVVLVGYPFFNTVRDMLEKGGYEISHIGYGVDIEMSVIVPYADVDALCSRVAELTAGAAVIEQAGDVYIDLPYSG